MIVYMDRASIEALSLEDIRDIVARHSHNTKYDRLEHYYVGIMISSIQKRQTRQGEITVLSIIWPVILRIRLPDIFWGSLWCTALRMRSIWKSCRIYLTIMMNRTTIRSLGSSAVLWGTALRLYYLDQYGKIRIGLSFSAEPDPVL